MSSAFIATRDQVEVFLYDLWGQRSEGRGSNVTTPVSGFLRSFLLFTLLAIRRPRLVLLRIILANLAIVARK